VRTRRDWAASSWPQRLVGAAAVVLAIAVVGMGVVVGTLNDRIDQMEARSQVVQSLLAAPDVQTLSMEGPEGSQARVLLSREIGQAVVFGHDMAPPPEGRDYELWFIHEDAFVAAGILTVDADGTASHSASGDLEGVVALGVTVEPAGGSPQPTSDPVMFVELTA
jgi:anti-sigma-K factor RskA